MDNFNQADSAVHGVSDISGVKDASLSHPEGDGDSEPRDADEAKTTGIADTDAAVLEAEFDELIHGRFSDVYKRRTESIIRKRLRSVKSHSDTEKLIDAPFSDKGSENDADSSAEKSDIKGIEDALLSIIGAIETQSKVPTESKISERDTAAKAAAFEQTRAKNKLRPLENGLGGSCGIVTRINVSALSGSDVISILNRVGAGEKISFK